MQEVKSGIFYHIDTKGFFQQGNTYQVGLQDNRFYDYYNTLAPNTMTFTNNVIAISDEMMKYIRERIYEDVRQEIDHRLPSREKALFLISPNQYKEKLNFWMTKQGVQGKIYQVECTGIMHTADQRFLIALPFNFEMQRYMARQYWTGVKMDEYSTLNEEVLFTGSLKVLKEVII